ncbi:MAG: hypothetical protein CVV24_05485 [Ignavibacteriae bacterium HGW-Ignavibacteriae-3]|nr:MAG: hypothetical protein CVV24_05485 [Ignavibacteriae bacterium HGW-Ignavibacteriae-3]
MNVLHINSYDTRGGAESVFSITRNLQGVDNFSGCVVLDKLTDNVNIPFHSWEENSLIAGSINYIFSFYNYNLLKKFLESNRIDIIHLHGFFASLSPSVLLAVRNAKRKQGIRVVQTLHDFHVVCPNASLYNYSVDKICEKCLGRKYKFSIFTNNCDRRGWAHSIIKGIRSFLSHNIINHRNIIDKFICPSEFLKNKLITDGIDANKIFIVSNPIMIKEVKQIPEKKNVICYFGRFSVEKDLPFLIKAFSKWKLKGSNSFELLLIGGGEEEGKLKSEVFQSAAKESIKILNYMPYSELVANVSHAKYFSLTSNCYENAPMSIMEAFSMNILPIAPDLGGMKESIDSIAGCGVSYQSGNVDSWIEAVELLERNYHDRIEKLNSIKGDILKNIGIENYYKNILDIYKVL